MRMPSARGLVPALLFAFAVACSDARADERSAWGALPAPRLEECLLCHGSHAQGNAAVRAPRLGGQQAAYLKRQLAAFRDGTRGMHPADADGAAMRAVALTMMDGRAEDDLLDQLTRLEAPGERADMARATTANGDRVRGSTHYAACAACHGADGAGNAALGAPALPLLDDWYLDVQLRHYRDGTRGAATNDVTGAQMRAAAAALTDDAAIADVIAYIRQLRR